MSAPLILSQSQGGFWDRVSAIRHTVTKPQKWKLFLFGKYQLFLTSEHQPGHNTQTGHSFGQKLSSENVVTIGDKRPYSYDDVDSEDITLKHFELQNEDINYKQLAIDDQLVTDSYYTGGTKLKQKSTLNLFASMWSPPLWMKTRKEWSGYSSLKEEYYQVLADYSVKFFDEYRQHNIEFWGMTTGNEPLDGFFSHSYSKINALGWIPSLQARWIRKNLAPTLHNRSYDDLKIIIHDDDRLTIPHVVPLVILTKKYI
ncbi:hypothetical protein NQ317_002510 [Molorchus minor]|uniref:Glucosylceramidase n=1 Tax=Molorchus minor TaxID=1323400 RepID=A0ABQ9J9E3_9CUCU|nr:hypothetical protein NQ317_002510 [Molorchus minor]